MPVGRACTQRQPGLTAGQVAGIGKAVKMSLKEAVVEVWAPAHLGLHFYPLK